MAIVIVTATAVSAQKKENMIVVSSVQTDKDNGYEDWKALTAIRWQARRISRRTPKGMQ